MGLAKAASGGGGQGLQPLGNEQLQNLFSSSRGAPAFYTWLFYCFICYLLSILCLGDRST